MATLDSLLKRLQSCDNDSEKFALLIIISRLLKPETIDSELQSRLAQAITWQFVNRLLEAKSENENSRIYWSLAVSMIKTCFLCVRYLTAISGAFPKIFKISLEDEEATEDAIQIARYLAQASPSPSELALVILPHITSVTSSEATPSHVTEWCTVLRDILDSSLEDNNCPELENHVIFAAEGMIGNLETESPTSIDKNIDLIVNTVTLISYRPFLHKKVSSLSKLVTCAETLLKTKIPAEKRLVLLQAAPFLTRECLDWHRAKLCYSLANIELKLCLEEQVHRLEEQMAQCEEVTAHNEEGTAHNDEGTAHNEEVTEQNEEGTEGDCEKEMEGGLEEVELEEGVVRGIVACCETVEGCIEILVESKEGDGISGEDLQNIIQEIRGTMSSSMFYLQHRQLSSQPCFGAVLRLFTRWLADDSHDVADIIATFQALKPFLENKDNFRSSESFLVGGIIFQMEDKSFRQFVKTDFGYFILEMALRHADQSPFLLAPVFNNLMICDIYLNMNKLIEKEGIAQIISQILNFEEGPCSAAGLTYIQLGCYIILCFNKRAHPIGSVCQHFDISRWIAKSINHSLSPLRNTEHPKNWHDFKEVWISSVNSICDLIEKSNEQINFSMVDMDFLARRSINYSEEGDTISQTLEDLLSIITA